MEAKFSKLYSFYKSQPKFFKLLLTFLLTDHHKNTLRIFEIVKIENFISFRLFSLTGDPMREKFQNTTPPTDRS